MANYSAQGSITIKRLRNGDTFFITLELANGIPLYQGVDDKNGSISPDWTIADNQPIIQPKVTSARGATVTLDFHKWTYNNIDLVFNGAAGSDGYKTDTTGKFKMNPNTGALKIIANLASKTNIANDTLTYSCQATVAGVEYTLTKSIDVLIQTVGATSYMGTITATHEQLDSTTKSSVLSTRLWVGAREITDYTTKWYKDNQEWTAKNGQKQITVLDTDVDGTQLFLCEFFESGSSTPCYRAGIRIIDTNDEFQVICYISSANKDVDTGQPVTVTGKIVRFIKGEQTTRDYTPSGATWRMDVYRPKDWKVLKTSNTNSIQVTTTETDADGEITDVEVVGECTFN